MEAWHTATAEEVARELATGHHGLQQAEAKARLLQWGANLIEEVPPPGVAIVLLRQFRSPVIFILGLAALVTLVLREFIDAGVIAAVLTLNAAIGFVQERRAEASVRALMGLVSPQAIVIRDGREWSIDSRELVPGDVVLLESGVRVPADLRLASTNDLRVDESLLTGESLPVTKTTAPETEVGLPIGDRRNLAYAGSTVTGGRARGYVVATGMRTELGAIAGQVRGQELPQTPLQERMARLGRVIGVIVLLSALGAFVLGVALGESISGMFGVAVALAVAAVPEGLPVAFTITLALGVRRMAQRNAIVRRLPAVETLGSTTIIGSDKTGTLTENRMTVRAIWADGSTYRVADEDISSAEAADEGEGVSLLAEHQPLYLTLLTGVLTNEAEVYRKGDGLETHGDPTEAALLVAAAHLNLEPADVRERYALLHDMPFEADLQYSASFRQREGRTFTFVKGAPERVLAMSSAILTRQGEAQLDHGQVAEAVQELAARGLRVLAMAYAETEGQQAQAGDEPHALTFLGLQGMMDPPRAGVREAIAGCRDAGVRVVMITGDHAVTARAIGRELGIVGEHDRVLTGTDLEHMGDDELAALVDSVAIYARVSPEHKLRVVHAYQARDHVVAVTGDGVNDAPALRAADIGIAMGRGGTDVAREAADMVLADDNFTSIYAAVEEGRVTFDNVRKVTFFLLSTGIAAIIAIIGALVLGWKIPLLAAQLLWLNLVTNGLQDIALAFEPGEAGVLKRRPRPRNEGVLSRVLWERAGLAGIVMAVGTLALFQWELDRGSSIEEARTVALTTMVLFQAFQVGNSRSEALSVFEKSPFSNRFLFIATIAALSVHVAALYLPPTQFVLRVEPPDLEAWLVMLPVALTVVIAVEADKLMRRLALNRDRLQSAS